MIALFLSWTALFAQAAQTPDRNVAPPGAVKPVLDCGYRSAQEWLDAFRAGVARGDVPDPSTRDLPRVVPRSTSAVSAAAPCLSNAHVFPFEDTNQILLTNYSACQLINLMANATNAVLTTHGDNFDFIGFWLNFAPSYQIGAAFYLGLENDVSGIGSSFYNFRPLLGVAGSQVEGWVMMWDVNTSYWAPGTGVDADFTRLALAQEFEHRYAMFLPNLPGGRRLQGDDLSCGRQAHWNTRVDGQGSGMEIGEWTGANPANLLGTLQFNVDTGGVFSFADLYLMGYVTPAEMDAGNSELRYMDSSTCAASYPGNISTFGSADIIASAGARVPDSANEDKHYRTAWIMIHLPGDAPDAGELSKAVAIMEQHSIDWEQGTLGRGTMDNSLFDDCNCITTYCQAKTNSCGQLPQIASSGQSSATQTSGYDVTASDAKAGRAGFLLYGMNGRARLAFAGGTLCMNPPLRRGIAVFAIGGTPGPACDAIFSIDWNAFAAGSLGGNPAPFLRSLGQRVQVQWWGRDTPAHGSFLSNALDYTVCP
jgi:hypothetical protein